MTCDEVKPLLNARLDDEVDPSLRVPLDAHLKTCPSCGADFTRLESLRDAVREGLVYQRAPAHLRDQVRFALRGSAYIDKRPGAGNWKVWGGAVAAAALLALAFTPFLLNGRNQSRM